MDEYYKYITDLNDKGGCWCADYYGIFSKVIRDNNYKNVAEVGIGYGFHSREILKNTNVEKHYMIDPMRDYDDGFAHDVKKHGTFDELYDKISNMLGDYIKTKRCVWFRKPSIEITNEEIPDESLDAVFIDGDHSYEAVLQDLNFWWNKVRKGGQILGDDYPGFETVRRAVYEFSQSKGISFDLLKKEIFFSI